MRRRPRQAFARRIRARYRSARLVGQVPRHRALSVALVGCVDELVCEALIGHEYLWVNGSLATCSWCDTPYAPGGWVR